MVGNNSSAWNDSQLKERILAPERGWNHHIIKGRPPESILGQYQGTVPAIWFKMDIFGQKVNFMNFIKFFQYPT